MTARSLLAFAATVVVSLLTAGCAVLGAPNDSPPATASTDTDTGTTDTAATDTAATEAVGALARVDRVVDGDTVVVEIGGRVEHVRLIGIDTPEKTGGLLPAECHGDAASAVTHELLPEGASVLLTRDVEPRDRYGRLLAYLYRADDGLFVNLVLVEQGHAAVLSIEPNTTHRARFEQAATAARAQGLGLWGECGGPDVALD